MAEKDDWRLTGQGRFLGGAVVRFAAYVRAREDWDHDHCAFCWAKFMEAGAGEGLHEGYVTEDGYYWICGRFARTLGGIGVKGKGRICG
jgi:hypothetical protein